MPFKSKAQIKACYTKQNLAKKQGKKSTWDCDAYMKETKNPKKLPAHVPKKKKGKK